MTGVLPRSVRIGYGSGSVATGAFGTVPGLMLLPYLTDSLGIAALVAGLIVLLPKAWDVVLNPVAGRISDRTSDPRGPRRPWLLRAGIDFIEALDPGALTDDDFDGLLAASGLLTSPSAGLALPDRLAPVNAMLDVASPALRESLLVAFLDRLQRPVRNASLGG